MYFPYLRGKQFELIALRELLDNHLIGDKVFPIIEPIKLSSTLITTIDTYLKHGANIGVIHNPKVGTIYDDFMDDEKEVLKEKYMNIIKDNSVTKTHILNLNSKFEINELSLIGTSESPVLIIGKTRDDFKFYTSEFGEIDVSGILMPDERALKRILKDNRVIFEDKFTKQSRNADYSNNEDEFFSDDHLAFKEEGYIGFSDYSVIGDEYADSGFAPYAVAIHIVYFDDEENLRVRHFVSDSNDDFNNPAKKFYEALEKLAHWQEKKQIKTYAMDRLMELYNTKNYPGLGVLKKLSIMHHIELVSNYLENK